LWDLVFKETDRLQWPQCSPSGDPWNHWDCSIGKISTSKTWFLAKIVEDGAFQSHSIL
jgi:hypothetical protein